MKTPNQQPNSSPLRRVLRWTVSVLSVLILLTAVVVMGTVLSARLSGKTPTVFGLSFHVVITGSMEPEISEGDLVVARRVSRDTIEVGDDIVFITRDPSLKGITIVHRVVRITEAGEFVTQGVKEGLPEDAYTVIEPIGVAVAVSPFWGKMLGGTLGVRDVLFLLLMLVIAALIVTELVSLIKRSRGATKKADAEQRPDGEPSDTDEQP